MTSIKLCLRLKYNNIIDCSGTSGRFYYGRKRPTPSFYITGYQVLLCTSAIDTPCSASYANDKSIYANAWMPFVRVYFWYSTLKDKLIS